MNICCSQKLPEGAKFCPYCGKKFAPRSTRRRGNGTGSVYQLPNKKWRAAVQVGEYLGDDGKRHRKVNSRNFDTKREAVAWVATPEARQERQTDLTLKELYDRWKPTHRGSDSLTGVYKAAFDKFRPLWHRKLSALTIDDLQACLDNTPRGKQTKENMKTVLNLMFKYGIPRKYVPDNLNLAGFLKVRAPKGKGKEGLPLDVLETMPRYFGQVPYIEYVYAHCYLGFRPGELLALDALDYDRKERALTGGSKTDAGRDRTVTVSPKIQPIVDELTRGKLSGPIFCKADGTRMSEAKYTAIFDAVLEAVGLENPVTVVNERRYKRYTPHSCRHTFATLMKNVQGVADGDKLAIIGHTDTKMLRHYEDVNYQDLRKITDRI